MSTILLYPLDLIKVRLQVKEEASGWFSRRHIDLQHQQAAENEALRKRTRGFIRTMTDVVRHEGFVALYQGLTPGLIASTVAWGGYFFCYEKIKIEIIERKERKYGRVVKIGSFETFFASCAASTVMIALTNPLWLIKTRMQLQVRLSDQQQHSSVGARAQYAGMIDAARTIVREEGPRALYKVRSSLV